MIKMVVAQNIHLDFIIFAEPFIRRAVAGHFAVPL